MWNNKNFLPAWISVKPFTTLLTRSSSISSILQRVELKINQYVITFILPKYSSSFNIVGPFWAFLYTDDPTTVARKTIQFFKMWKRTYGEMAVKKRVHTYRANWCVINYVHLNWWLWMLLLCYASPIHIYFPYLFLLRWHRIVSNNKRKFYQHYRRVWWKFLHTRIFLNRPDWFCSLHNVLFTG
jgi:hypothetical protein